MSLCGRVSGNIVGADCSDIIQPGVESEAYIINLADIDRATSTVDSDGMITNIAITTVGAAAYLVQTLERGLRGEVALVKGTYVSSYDHKVGIKIFDNSPLIKKGIDNLEKGKYCIILKNKYLKSSAVSPELVGQTVYEAYGWTQGLQAMEITRATDDNELKSGYNIVMGTMEGEQETFLPRIVFKTSLAATEAMLVALLTPVPTP